MLNERLYAAHENELLFQGLLPRKAHTSAATNMAHAKESVTLSRIAAERATRTAILDTARRHLINPVSDRRGKAGSVGRGRSSSMDILNRMFDDAPHASSFFRINSAVAHSSLHGQVRMLQMAERDDGTFTSRPVPMHPDDLAAQAWPAVAATAIAATNLFSQAGWPTAALDVAVASLVAEWDAPPDENLLQALDALV